MGVAVLYGLGIIFSLAIIGSLVFSLLLRFTAIQENSLQYIVTTISFIALFVGGFITGGKGKQKGWLLGGVTGGTYTLLVLLFQYLGYDSLFSMEQMVYHVCYIITAMMGGILGVNMTSGKN